MTRPRARTVTTGAALAAMLVGVGAPASAEEPVYREVTELTAPVNFPAIPFRCGDVTGELTGTLIRRVQVRDRTDGTDTFTVTIRGKDRVFRTDDGQEYRVIEHLVTKGYFVGGAPDPSDMAGPPPNAVVTFSRGNIVVLGEQGQLGALHDRVDGDTRTTKGECDYIGGGAP